MVLITLPILVCTVMLFYRRPLLLLYMWPVFILLSAIFVDANVEVDGFARLPFMFLPMDVVYGFTLIHLAMYAALQPNRFVALLKENPFLTIFLALVALYVVIYTPIYGKTAIGEARKFYFMFTLPLLALVSIRTLQDLRGLIRLIVLCAACLAVFGIFQGAMSGSLVRILNSTQTLIIAFAVFAMIIHRIYGMVIITQRVDMALLCLFSGMVLWSGQRTVWIATGLGLLLLFVLYRSRSTIIAKAGVAVIGVLLSLIMAVVVFPESGERIVRGFEGILNPQADGTASWRIEGWRQHLNRIYRDGNLLFGEGLGTYYRWDSEGWAVEASPHNAYVQAILKFGLIGLTMYVLLALHFFRKVLRARKMLPPGPTKAYIDMGILNFGAGHAYGLGYGFEPSMLVFFAVAATAAKLCESSSTVAFSTMTYPHPLRSDMDRSQPTGSPQGA